MKWQVHGLLLLSGVALCAGHAGLLRQKAISDAGFTERLSGVRHCLNLHGGDEMEVLAMKQRYGKESFLVARPAGSPKLVAKAALHATYEAVLRGAGCADAKDQSSASWFLDVGTDDDELLALASSLGCGVSVLDPEVKDVRAVDMTRCMNEEANRPFVVFQVTASNMTNPETLANMTNASRAAAATNQWSDTSNSSHKTSLLGIKKVWPKMLNSLKKKKVQQQEEAEQNTEESDPQDTSDASKNATAMQAEEEDAVEVQEPMEPGVMLDTIFTKADAPSTPVEVATPTGESVSVNKIALLKVTPRSESVATLKALQGAHNLLQSGRVQCLVTEMNFDMNHTESFLEYVAELEHSGFQFAHVGSLDYSELEISDKGQYEVFRTDSKQLQELFDTYKRIRSFDERSGFRVYSGSLSLDRKGHYFDYTDLIFGCKGSFPERLSLLEKGKIRFRNGVWWLEKVLAGQ